MKILKVYTNLIRIPLKTSVASSTVKLTSFDFGIIRVLTDCDIEGISYFVTPAHASRAMYSVLKDELAPSLIDKNPLFAEKIWDELWKKTQFYGRKGIAIYALAACDMALWDVIGKAAKKPLYELFGVYNDKLRMYASGGWMTSTIKELQEEMASYMEQGYTMVKLKVGHPDMNEDIKRLAAIRKIVGEKTKILLDANQYWDVRNAVRFGRKAQEYDAYWLEEPVSADDIEGCAQVRQALDMPIATGETEYCRYGFMDLIGKKALDIANIDLFRAGGITEWRKIAHLCELHRIEVSPHSHIDVQAHLMASLPNAGVMEVHTLNRACMNTIFEGLSEIRNGFMRPSDLPGLGLVLKEGVLEKYAF